MKYFLMLIILGLCGAGYYEYTFFQSKLAADHQQISDFQGTMDAITAQKQKLETDNATLQKSATDTQTEMAGLTQQLQAMQASLAASKQQQAAPAPVTTPTPSVAAPASNSSNNLGTIATTDGKTYLNCQLLRVQTDCIVINHSAGISQVAYSLMPPTLQKQFGYDPLSMTALPDAQVQSLEQKRKTAAGY